MSGVEALARVLALVNYRGNHRLAEADVDSWCPLADALVADPGPLLEALAEAGVLREAEAERTDTPPLAYCAGCGKPQPEHEHQWRTYWHHDACDCGATRRQHDEDCHKCDEVERSARQIIGSRSVTENQPVEPPRSPTEDA